MKWILDIPIWFCSTRWLRIDLLHQNLNFYSFARASKFKWGVQNHPLCFTEIDQTQDQNAPNISRSIYVGLNWCQKFHLRFDMGIKIGLGVEKKNCSSALRGLPRMAFWAAALSSCQWYSPALVERMQPEIGYKGRTFIATGAQQIKSQTASQKVQMAFILPTWIWFTGLLSIQNKI